MSLTPSIDAAVFLSDFGEDGTLLDGSKIRLCFDRIREEAYDDGNGGSSLKPLLVCSEAHGAALKQSGRVTIKGVVYYVVGPEESDGGMAAFRLSTAKPPEEVEV